MSLSDTGKLAVALAAFQSEMPIVAKKHTAEVAMKSGGKYRYTYADLADITESAMPLLTKHGLAFSACPRQTERGYELCGRLLHESGESLDGSLPIAGNTPQELGSSITYMRRYLFGCITGLVTDDDDDGQLAQRIAAKKAPAKRAAAKPSDEPPTAANQPMTDGTRRTMFALFSDLDIADDDQLPGINHILGTDYPSRGRLSEAEARRVIDVLKRKKAS
jgi:hypothetical protein